MGPSVTRQPRRCPGSSVPAGPPSCGEGRRHLPALTFVSLGLRDPRGPSATLGLSCTACKVSAGLEGARLSPHTLRFQPWVSGRLEGALTLGVRAAGSESDPGRRNRSPGWPCQEDSALTALKGPKIVGDAARRVLTRTAGGCEETNRGEGRRGPGSWQCTLSQGSSRRTRAPERWACGGGQR